MRVRAIILGTFMAISPCLGQTAPVADQKLNSCIAKRAQQYAGLPDPADVVARGIAYACAPKPPPKFPSTDPNSKYEHGLALDHFIRESAHEMAYGEALVSILDIRSGTQRGK